MYPLLKLPKRFGNRIIFGFATLGFMFLTTACPDISNSTEPCLEQTCVENRDWNPTSCNCECVDGYVLVNDTCRQVGGQAQLEADVSGTDVTGTFHYVAADVDIEFLGDSLIIDGYIDEANPDNSSYIYLRIINLPGVDIVAGERYDLSIGTGPEDDFASHRYPFDKSNVIYTVDTGSVYINFIDMNSKILDAEFSFACKTTVKGEKRLVENGWVKTD
jgi:hypothetical protein